MALKSVSTTALRAELARRERGAAQLQKKHSMLSRVLASLEAELAPAANRAVRVAARPAVEPDASCLATSRAWATRWRAPSGPERWSRRPRP